MQFIFKMIILMYSVDIGSYAVNTDFYYAIYCETAEAISVTSTCTPKKFILLHYITQSIHFNRHADTPENDRPNRHFLNYEKYTNICENEYIRELTQHFYLDISVFYMYMRFYFLNN